MLTKSLLEKVSLPFKLNNPTGDDYREVGGIFRNPAIELEKMVPIGGSDHVEYSLTSIEGFSNTGNYGAYTDVAVDVATANILKVLDNCRNTIIPKLINGWKELQAISSTLISPTEVCNLRLKVKTYPLILSSDYFTQLATKYRYKANVNQAIFLSKNVGMPNILDGSLLRDQIAGSEVSADDELMKYVDSLTDDDLVSAYRLIFLLSSPLSDDSLKSMLFTDNINSNGKARDIRRNVMGAGLAIIGHLLSLSLYDNPLDTTSGSLEDYNHYIKSIIDYTAKYISTIPEQRENNLATSYMVLVRKANTDGTIDIYTDGGMLSTYCDNGGSVEALLGAVHLSKPTGIEFLTKNKDVLEIAYNNYITQKSIALTKEHTLRMEKDYIDIVTKITCGRFLSKNIMPQWYTDEYQFYTSILKEFTLSNITTLEKQYVYAYIDMWAKSPEEDPHSIAMAAAVKLLTIMLIS